MLLAIAVLIAVGVSFAVCARVVNGEFDAPERPTSVREYW